jgi:hypothetical protein
MRTARPTALPVSSRSAHVGGWLAHEINSNLASSRQVALWTTSSICDRIASRESARRITRTAMAIERLALGVTA